MAALYPMDGRNGMNGMNGMNGEVRAGGAGGAEGAAIGGAGAAAPGPAFPALITADIISKFYNLARKEEAFHSLKELLIRNRDKLRRTHIVQARDYSTVYIGSDIHGDFRKLVQMMVGMKLIHTTINPYGDDSIYNPKLITETTWIAGPNVLLVLIGDLVDGKRFYSDVGLSNSPIDPYGSFELLIYCFLYNLRLKALTQNSEIICTIGNHELMTVLEPHPEIRDNFINTYVTDEAYFFFDGDKDNGEKRADVLSSFIKHSWPFYMIGIHNGEKKEVAFVHGGLHINNSDDESNPIDITDKFQQMQFAVDANNDNLVNEYVKRYVNSNNMNTGLWTREYATRTSCEIFKRTPYPLIAVGHCVTDMNYLRINELRKNYGVLYAGCSTEHSKDKGRGCVYYDCNNRSRGGPQLVFVDTGLSKGQRPPTNPEKGREETNNETRVAEFIMLKGGEPAAAIAPMDGAGGAAAGGAGEEPLGSRFYYIMQRVPSVPRDPEHVNLDILFIGKGDPPASDEQVAADNIKSAAALAKAATEAALKTQGGGRSPRKNVRTRRRRAYRGGARKSKNRRGMKKNK